MIRTDYRPWESARNRFFRAGRGRPKSFPRTMRTARPGEFPGRAVRGRPEPLRSGSAGVEEAVQHPDAELQAVHRHPLVHAVEHAGEVEVRRELQRGEAEA